MFALGSSFHWTQVKPGLTRRPSFFFPNPPIIRSFDCIARLHPAERTDGTMKEKWQLKKYARTSDDLHKEQEEYATMEYSPQKPTRRPRQRPGEAQEFVFVDLSPKKKEAKVKRQGLSRLFRLSGSEKLATSTLVVDTKMVETKERPELKMTVSSDGRAILQHSSASSSATDLFSLHRSPSPKRAGSDCSSDEDDAGKAFERAVRRKRANTGGSVASCRLTRNQSSSSLASIRARNSPVRVLRQPTPVDLRPSENYMGSFFDDTSNEPITAGRGHLRAQRSISTLGPPMGIATLGPAMGEYGRDIGITTLGPAMGEYDLKEDMAQFFDFTAFDVEAEPCL